MRELKEALDQVRSRIARHSGSRQLNEENTKATLVEPVLRTLGWDVEDFEEVQREYRRRSRDKPVDYALLVLRVPRLFIEAKALGQNLEDRRWANQIMGYAAVAGVEWVVLTNGDEYRLYNAHAPVAVEDKLFRTIRVTQEQSPAEETLGLLSKSRMEENRIAVLWNAHYVDKQVHIAIENLFATDTDAGLIRLIKKQTPNLSPKEIRASLARARLQLDFPVETISGTSSGKATDRHRKSRNVSSEPKIGKPPVGISVRNLIEAGLIRPPLDLERTYKDRLLTAQIRNDGQISCLGETYDSLSNAAGMARASIIGTRPGRKYPQTNGWTFWRFKDADGQLKEMDYLRQECLERKR
ncbi:MAG: type I restriction enzyme HsdR N-terminal domain-containing protein [Candidatus Eisenbacteria bacterium]|uniref:Type I restriction enzyme HsdR N-terminal domain-containing protein n=1 Tax=Eiseniibacteriota bacterium TaxID=2212470 RepID=A0A948W7H7_UNCEI|nr:type I restriction enzyme HsdR N-terminal domain-containing protein [Candidatus Eisenbacteria bacterium]MBU1947552.1 type I restriction enzyme HsdR N-terminal domain-containing protein [Candidatus Eisenbacteria bacterium]MBU2691646.1 type I restriction enzyme HsdR N-terminal domain-containing protein [Candidatus Eisenbacteria bacterium]